MCSSLDKNAFHFAFLFTPLWWVYKYRLHRTCNLFVLYVNEHSHSLTIFIVTEWNKSPLKERWERKHEWMDGWSLSNSNDTISQSHHPHNLKFIFQLSALLTNIANCMSYKFISHVSIYRSVARLFYAPHCLRM